MPDYLIYDPDSNEIVGNPTLSEQQLPFNVKGNQIAFELDGEYYRFSMDAGTGIPSQSFNIDAVRRPLIAKVDRLAAEAMSDPFEAIHTAQAAEASALDGPTPFIDAIAAQTGRDRKDVAASIAAKANAEHARRVAINARRLADKAAISAASNIPELYAVAVNIRPHE